MIKKTCSSVLMFVLQTCWGVNPATSEPACTTTLLLLLHLMWWAVCAPDCGDHYNSLVFLVSPDAIYETSLCMLGLWWLRPRPQESLMQTVLAEHTPTWKPFTTGQPGQWQTVSDESSLAAAEAKTIQFAFCNINLNIFRNVLNLVNLHGLSELSVFFVLQIHKTVFA